MIQVDMYYKFVKLLLASNKLVSCTFNHVQIDKYSQQFVLHNAIKLDDVKIYHNDWEISFEHDYIIFIRNEKIFGISFNSNYINEYQYISSKMLYYIITNFNGKDITLFFNLFRYGYYITTSDYNRLLLYYGHEIMAMLLLIMFDYSLSVDSVTHSFNKYIHIVGADKTYSFIVELNRLSNTCTLCTPFINTVTYRLIPPRVKVLYDVYNYFYKFGLSFNDQENS